MAAELQKYWFTAAVFRDAQDLAATVCDLRAGNFVERQLLVLANHEADGARRVLDGEGGGDVAVVHVSDDGAVTLADDGRLPAGLTALLQALDARQGPRERFNGSASGPTDEHASPVYRQLRRDVRDGSLVLIADVAGPEEQLAGARIMLKGRCECVLTHEMAPAVA